MSGCSFPAGNQTQVKIRRSPEERVAKPGGRKIPYMHVKNL